MRTPVFIAEIYPQDPFGFKSKHSFLELMRIAIAHGDWLAVNVNNLYGGDLDTLAYVRQHTDKTIIAKGVFGSDKMVRQAIECGANYISVSNRIPNFNEVNPVRCFIEYNNLEANMETLENNAANLRHCTFSYNAIDTDTGLKKPDDLLNKFLSYAMTYCRSINYVGIESPEQIEPNFRFFTVNKSLPEYCANHIIQPQ